MLKITIIELILRAIPEAFLLTLLVYLICNKNVRNKAYFISSIIFAASMYLIRALPIQFGIHTIIIIMTFIVINNLINKIPVKKSIVSSMTAMITLSVCESANFIILSFTKVDIGKIYDDPILKIVCFTPSLIFIIVISYILYLVKNKTKRGFNNVSNWKDI